jgi:hypothetical protein
MKLFPHSIFLSAVADSNKDFFYGLKHSNDSPFWAYGSAIVFIFLGIHLIRKWRKVRSPNASA